LVGRLYGHRVEARGAPCPCSWNGDLTGTGSIKARKNEYVWLKIQLIFIFPCFCQIDIDQVTILDIMTSRTVNLYFRGTFMIIV